MIPAILEQMNQGGEIQLGNLEARRDFIYVRDVAQALLALVKAENQSFGIFNVGTGYEYSIRDVVEACEAIVKRPLTIQTVPSRQRKQERWHLLADISHIKEAIGWEPTYDLYLGLVETIAEVETAVCLSRGGVQ